MLLVSTRQAKALTGLSTAKLREWTNRRALIPADVPPRAQGSPARYGWHTILLLRIAITLRQHFHLELQAHRQMFRHLGNQLRETSFVALWGKSLALYAPDRWALLESREQSDIADDVLLIRLTPHLEIITVGFAIAHPYRAPGQLELFPVEQVPDSGNQVTNPREGRGRLANQRSRRRE